MGLLGLAFPESTCSDTFLKSQWWEGWLWCLLKTNHINCVPLGTAPGAIYKTSLILCRQHLYEYCSFLKIKELRNGQVKWLTHGLRAHWWLRSAQAAWTLKHPTSVLQYKRNAICAHWQSLSVHLAVTAPRESPWAVQASHLPGRNGGQREEMTSVHLEAEKVKKLSRVSTVSSFTSALLLHSNNLIWAKRNWFMNLRRSELDQFPLCCMYILRSQWITI